MKSIITLFFYSVIFINSAAFSQSKIVHGYIIKLNGDTVKGDAINRDLMRTAESVSFKSAGDAEFIIYGPKDILGFGIDSSENFISGNFSIDVSPFRSEDLTHDNIATYKDMHVFIKRIFNGKLKLYSLYDTDEKQHYFISTGDSTPVELIYRLYLANIGSTTNIVRQEKYKNQLVFYMKDCSEIENKIKRSGFVEKDLLGLFEYYSECIGEKIFIEKPVSKVKSRLGVFAGLNRYEMKFSGSYNYKNLLNTTFEKDNSFTAGLKIIVPVRKKFNHHELAINIGFTVVNFTSSSVQTFETLLGLNTRNYEYKINYNSLKTDAAYHYKFFKKEDKIVYFLSFGIAYEYIFNSEYTSSLVESYPHTSYPEVTESLFNGGERNFQWFVFAGAGIVFKNNYSLEFDYERGNGILDYTNLTSTTNGLKLNLIYLF